MRRSLHSLLTLSLFCLWNLDTHAGDHFVIVGGGPSPFNNQVSLESNVLFSQRVLEKIRDDEPDRKVFFADGKIDKPDLQYLDPDLEHTSAVRWMSCIFGDDDASNYRYRNHQIENVDGPTRKAFVKQAFFELAESLEAGDRLIVYVTAHGGQPNRYYEREYYDDDYSDGGNPVDTTIALWSNDTLNVSELDTWLNKFSTDVRVVLIMAQCHSGGFAHSIFHHADKKRGLNPQVRVGFFSQQYDRAAAGCTPEIDESNYREYSTYFWEAMGGMTRGGDEIESPDFDGDGTVSFCEAHAHAIIASETIDIPMTSGDVFLRRYSRIAPPPGDEEADSEPTSFFGSLFGGGAKPSDETKSESEPAKPLGREETIESLLELAHPDQVAVIKHLAKALKVNQEDPVSKVRRRAKRLQESAEAATQTWSAAVTLAEGERRTLAGAVSLNWPALGSEVFSPMMSELTNAKASEFVEFVEAQPQCDSYLQAMSKADELEKKMDKAVNREARMRRLLRTLENVLLEQNLSHHATADQQRHFERMTSLEREGIASTDSE